MNIELILIAIGDYKSKITEKDLKKYNLSQTEKIVKRLDSFGNDCSECKAFLENYQILFDGLAANTADFNIRYFQLTKTVISHLQKKHKIVTENYYTNMYMSLGIALGLPFGLIFSQILGQYAYLGLGLPIGIGIGISIGASLDKQAIKEGMVI